MKYIFIVNKVAGKGKYKKIVPKIENECEKRNLQYEIRYITEEINSNQIVSEYEKEENIIYIVGGDGTLTNILSGIVKTKNKLGIIPSGSGNDTYRTIKMLPKGENVIDLAKINDKYFINVACMGIDAEVANNVDILRNTIIPSSQLYNASIFYTFVKFRFKKMQLKTDIKNIEDKYSILSICNGGYYGGGFNIAPKSQLTDGLLDIYYAEKMSRLKMIPLLLKVKKGTHEGKRRVHKFRTKHIEINVEKNITFNVDGEKLTDNHFVIDVLPKAITVYNDDEFVKNILENK
ncbi:MAG: YegS/Rv2252/BmrU family lipid kinase [Clostridiaceae bacterium]|nr:YegS/Rv2252/BmrU family lipid kinase [Clostridiaceae bacterium]